MANTSCEDEWELCNDNGFVYKRRKRHHNSATTPLAPPPPPPPDPDAELRLRRARKKKILMKVRDQYHKEIQQWEALLATLQEMKDRTHNPQPPPTPQELALQPLHAPKEDAVFCPMIDEMLLQAEAQEAFLQDMTNLCKIAETMCKAQEERFKQSFIDLPVWETPHSLMASLSEVEDG
ncbi:hypothetical protein AAC387_Pa02g3630 [Persea americana]